MQEHTIQCHLRVLTKSCISKKSCEFIDTSNSPNRGYNPLPDAHLPHYPSHFPPTHPLIYTTCDTTVAVNKVAQNPAMLAS